jgi:hypothetical protein
VAARVGVWELKSSASRIVDTRRVLRRKYPRMDH